MIFQIGEEVTYTSWYGTKHRLIILDINEKGVFLNNGIWLSGEFIRYITSLEDSIDYQHEQLKYDKFKKQYIEKIRHMGYN